VDDIRWNRAMYAAWNDLRAHADVTLSIDLGYLGLLFFQGGMKKQHYTLKM